MSSPSELAVPPIDGVVFDFHATLVHQGSGSGRLELAANHLARSGGVPPQLAAYEHDRLADALEHIWVIARDLDPDSRRDLDPARHRAVFLEVMATVGGVDPALAESLYETLPDGWTAYDDAVPVLQALRRYGVRTAVLSNVGFDIRPVLERTGLMGVVDGVVLSCEIGVTKPEPAAFQAALDAIDVPAGRALMVGDTWRDDGAAAQVGMRTLLIPASMGPVHGLGQVLSLVAGSRGGVPL